MWRTPIRFELLETRGCMLICQHISFVANYGGYHAFRFSLTSQMVATKNIIAWLQAIIPWQIGNSCAAAAHSQIEADCWDIIYRLVLRLARWVCVCVRVFLLLGIFLYSSSSGAIGCSAIEHARLSAFKTIIRHSRWNLILPSYAAFVTITAFNHA